MWGLQRKNGETPRFVGPICGRRRGLSAAEVIVITAIIAVIALCAVMALPRRRETARLEACRKNLMQIGQALVLYDQSLGHLPTVPDLGSGANGPRDSPLKALLDDR